MLFLAPELRVSARKPLTVIEESARGSCRSTTASEGVCAWPRLFFYVCVCVCEGETRWAVNQSEPVLGQSSRCFLFFFFFLVIGSHRIAFSRWFPAGLHMTCDNITVLKGQAWREPVGGLEGGPVLRAHTVLQRISVTFKRNVLLWISSSVLNILPVTGRCKYLQDHLNLGGPRVSRREGVPVFTADLQKNK